MKTFRIGGVHPAENKLSAGKAIETLALPKQAVFPLSQHIGAPATAIVKKGDVVKVGTKIAEAGGFVSAAIFSSVSGKVNKVDAVIDASGYRKPAIFIDVDGDEWEESIDRSSTLVKECALTPEEIVAKVKNAGVVGMGGACFPTHVKLSPPPGCKVFRCRQQVLWEAYVLRFSQMPHYDCHFMLQKAVAEFVVARFVQFFL